MSRIRSLFRVGGRIALAGLVPLFSFLFFAAFEVRDSWQRRDEAIRAQSVGDFLPAVSNLIGGLQKLRGLSALYLSTGTDANRERLREQRAVVDAAFALLQEKATASTRAALGSDLNATLHAAMNEQERVRAMQSAIDARQVALPRSFAEHSAIITGYLAVAHGAVRTQNDRRMIMYMQALASLLEAKERAGQERAVGSSGFAATQFPAETFRTFASIGAAETVYLAQANSLVPPALRSEIASLADDPRSKEVATYRSLALKSFQGSSVPPETASRWFDAATERMKLMDEIETRFLSSMSEEASSLVRSETISLAWMAAVVGLVLVMAALISWLLTRSITRPIAELVADTERLAGGDTTVRFAVADRFDQIGEIASAVRQFRDTVAEQHRLAIDFKASVDAREENNRATEKAVQSFSTAADTVLAKVSDSASSMRTIAQGLIQVAGNANEQSVSAATQSEQAASNVGAVAAATEQLSASIQEIGRQVQQASDVVQRAGGISQTSAHEIEVLAQAAQRIGAVVDLIQAIAEQTNLLALNATIEAARAGDAGRGFAVVAQEVKTLAGQTAKATEEISQHIAAIQQSTRTAVDAVREMGGAMHEIKQVTTTIASAMEEQGAATREISRNVQMAARGTQALSANIASVNNEISETNRSANSMLSASNELTSASERMADEVRMFFVALRSGPLDQRRQDDPNYKGPERRQSRTGAVAYGREGRVA